MLGSTTASPSSLTSRVCPVALAGCEFDAASSKETTTGSRTLYRGARRRSATNWRRRLAIVRISSGISALTSSDAKESLALSVGVLGETSPARSRDRFCVHRSARAKFKLDDGKDGALAACPSTSESRWPPPRIVAARERAAQSLAQWPEGSGARKAHASAARASKGARLRESVGEKFILISSSRSPSTVLRRGVLSHFSDACVGPQFSVACVSPHFFAGVGPMGLPRASLFCMPEASM